MSKLEDLLAKKKTVVPVLDLSKNIVQSRDEFKRLMEKVPDFKMRPIKVRTEEIKIKEKDYGFKLRKKKRRKLTKRGGEFESFYLYADPVPGEMCNVVLMELCAVQIDWKMLTTLRPKTKLDEEYFSRMVEMGKLQLKTAAQDKRDPFINNCVKKMKNKSGIVETRRISCVDCGEEMCNGKTCTAFNYDLFARVEPKPIKPKPIPHNSNKGKLHSRKPLRNHGKSNKSKNK